MDAYSNDLRLRVLQDCDAGMATRVVATKYRVSESWVRRLKQRRRETGETTPRSSRPKSATKTLDAHQETLERLVAEQPDLTLGELQERLPVRVDRSTICRALQELRLSFKKKSCMRRSKTGRTSASNARLGKPK